MNESATGLPEFEKPPLVEVAISVQFETIEPLTAPIMGVLWDHHYKDEFPELEAHGALDPVIEDFGPGRRMGSRPRIEFADRPPPPRLWFRKSDGGELIQIQNNRFVRNWRIAPGTDPTYPRYRELRARFDEDLSKFEQFLKGRDLGTLAVNQCEITYVNHIFPEDVWSGHGELDKVIRCWRAEHCDEAEDVRFEVRRLLHDAAGEPMGRLYVKCEPAFQRDGHQSIFVLTLIARGQTTTGGRPDLSFLDVGHDAIVSSFAAITTTQMHDVWRRIR